MKKLLITTLALALTVSMLYPLAARGQTRVTVEAETASTIEPPCVVVHKDAVPPLSKYVAGASADTYLEIPQGVGNPPKNPNGHAVIEIDVPADGDYTLWGRVWWDDECGNSFTVQINDDAPFLFGENATYKIWHWVRYPVARTAKPIKLKKGTHTVTFFNREDGVRLDQVLLSADKRFVPIACEPVGVKEK